MDYLKLAFLAFIAYSVCEVSHGQCMRRVRPASALAPRHPPPTSGPCNNNAASSSYERSLEQLISKLINALIYTVLQHCGNGGGAGNGGGSSVSGGSNAGGSLLDLDLGLGGKSILDVGVLGSNSKGSSGGGDSLLDLGVGLVGNPLLDVSLLGSKQTGGSGGAAGSGGGVCGPCTNSAGDGGRTASRSDDDLLDINLGLAGTSVLDVGLLGSNPKGNGGVKGDSEIISALLALGVDLGDVSLLDLILGANKGGSREVASGGGAGSPDLLNLRATLAGTPLADLSVL